jgi:hypothetical protein
VRHDGENALSTALGGNQRNAAETCKRLQLWNTQTSAAGKHGIETARVTLSTREVCKRIGVGQSTIHRMMAAGKPARHVKLFDSTCSLESLCVLFRRRAPRSRAYNRCHDVQPFAHEKVSAQPRRLLCARTRLHGDVVVG